jgi:hypothetical protein
MNMPFTPEFDRQIELQIGEQQSRETSLINQRIAKGMAQLDCGEVISGDEARRLTKDRIAIRRNAKRMRQA